MEITEFVRSGQAAVGVFGIADIQGIVRTGVFTFQIAAARRQFQGNGLAQFNGVRDPQEKIPLVIVVDLLVDGQGGGEQGMSPTVAKISSASSGFTPPGLGAPRP